MKQGTTLILTNQEKDALIEARKIILNFSFTDAAKEELKELEDLKNELHKNCFDIALDVLTSAFNLTIREYTQN